MFGTITKNNINGIYGDYTGKISNNNLIEVATSDEIELGSAVIKTVVDGSKVSAYEIEILKIYPSNETKNLLFKVTDKELLNKTGGIVQGMSGSPIIQNNKIIGAVTHVIVDKPTTGYGILITNMLKEGES